jgi:hypothetical protein
MQHTGRNAKKKGMGGYIKTVVETTNFVMKVMNIWLRFLQWRNSPPPLLQWAKASSMTGIHDHTQTHYTQ